MPEEGPHAQHPARSTRERKSAAQLSERSSQGDTKPTKLIRSQVHRENAYDYTVLNTCSMSIGTNLALADGYGANVSSLAPKEGLFGSH